MAIVPTKTGCFECEEGHYHNVIIDYFSHLSQGRSVVTRGVKIQRCDRCGAEMLDADASRQIEDNIERHFPGYYDKWKIKAKPRL